MSGLVLNEDVKWVSFHSSYDFGYLVKTLTCTELPTDEPAFMDSLHTFFPCIYDVKVRERSRGRNSVCVWERESEKEKKRDRERERNRQTARNRKRRKKRLRTVYLFRLHIFYAYSTRLLIYFICVILFYWHHFILSDKYLYVLFCSLTLPLIFT